MRETGGHSTDSQSLAALVLCGGQSRRMGSPKYRLAFGEETLLQRICRIAGGVAGPVVIVAAADQDLTAAPVECLVVRDSNAERGPLQAISDGLAFISSEFPGGAFADSRSNSGLTPPARQSRDCQSTAVFVTACDCPLLTEVVIQFLSVQLTDEHEAVVIRDGPHCHPLCAVYRIEPARNATSRLLNSGVNRAASLAESLVTRWVELDELRTVDPQLDCLVNCNTPEDYRAALDLSLRR